MPWTGQSFQKHNHKLKGKAAEKAAHQANAILEKTGDEGMAIAVANKNAGKHKTRDQKIASMYPKKKK